MAVYEYPYTDFNEYNLDWCIKRIRDLTDEWKATHDEWETVEAAWEDYKHYFDNLNVQDEIDNKINKMIEDGTFSIIVRPFFDEAIADIPNAVADWLADHVDPDTGYVIDDTLTIQNAAADAKAVGDALASIDSVVGHRKNLFDISTYDPADVTISGNSITGLLKKINGKDMTIVGGAKANTAYTISTTANISTVLSNAVACQIYVIYTDTTYNRLYYYRADVTSPTRMSGTTDPTKTVDRFEIWNSTTATGNTTWTVADIQIEEGNIATTYEPYTLTAVDSIARDMANGMPSTGDMTDRTNDITRLLNTFGYCKLGAGDFFVKNIEMPNFSMLSGCGELTRIIFTGDINGAIKLGVNCTVKDLSFYGDLNDITLTDDILGIKTENTTATNLWQNGNVSVPAPDGYVHLVLTNPLPAGTYRIGAVVTSTDTDSDVSYIGFSTSTTTNIPNNTIVASTTLTRDSRAVSFLKIPTTVYSVRIRAGENSSGSDGDSATWDGIRITEVGGRSGIYYDGSWDTTVDGTGTIENCRFYNFDCAGILSEKGGTSTHRGLKISDCEFAGNNCGIYFRQNAEYNNVTNCVSVKNYFGTLNRGGNNFYGQCAFDSNYVNAQIDAAEGVNHAHGAFIGCSFNHGHDNDHDNIGGYSLIIRNAANTMFNGCQIGWGYVYLYNTSGNVFSGCRFGTNNETTIEDGSCNILSGCLIASASPSPVFTYINNNKTKAVGCYYNNGTEFVIS